MKLDLGYRKILFQLMLLALIVFAAIEGFSMGSRNLDTNVPLRAVPMFETFLIRSDLPVGEMTETIFRLFAENKTLRKLSCNKNESGTLHPICHIRRSDDLFMAYFDPRDYSLILSLDPQNYEVGYKPDYKYFYRLREELRQSLEAAFGKEQVIRGATRKATAPEVESRGYFNETFKTREFPIPLNKTE